MLYFFAYYMLMVHQFSDRIKNKSVLPRFEVPPRLVCNDKFIQIEINSSAFYLMLPEGTLPPDYL